MLKQYGSAYLVTSISLAVVSFTTCYVLVDSGKSESDPEASINFDVGVDVAVTVSA